MIADRLRASILQAAISGKLTDQRKEDGTPAELLEQIAAERAQRSKDKKLKQQSPIEPLAEGSMSGQVPSNWLSVTLGDLVLHHVGGGTPSKANPAYWGGDIPWASVKDLKGRYLGTTLESISQEGLEKSSANLVSEGSIVVCMRMAVGKAVVTTSQIAINQDLRALELTRFFNREFFLYWYESQDIQGSGVTVKGIKIGTLFGLRVELPPLAEQERIVAKLDEVLPLIDQLAELERERESI